MSKEEKKYTYRIIKHIVFGKNKGRRMTDYVHFDHKDQIYDFLFDCADKFEAGRCNYIVEHTKLI